MGGLIAINGCVFDNSIVLRPIETKDFWRIKSGSTFTYNGTISVIDRDGYVLSDMYMKDIMKIKVEK